MLLAKGSPEQIEIAVAVKIKKRCRSADLLSNFILNLIEASHESRVSLVRLSNIELTTKNRLKGRIVGRFECYQVQQSPPGSLLESHRGCGRIYQLSFDAGRDNRFRIMPAFEIIRSERRARAALPEPLKFLDQ